MVHYKTEKSRNEAIEQAIIERYEQKPIFTQKHFIAIAQRLAKTEPLEKRGIIAFWLYDYFSEVNPKFKKELFLRKSGIG